MINFQVNVFQNGRFDYDYIVWMDRSLKLGEGKSRTKQGAIDAACQVVQAKVEETKVTGAVTVRLKQPGETLGQALGKTLYLKASGWREREREERRRHDAAEAHSAALRARLAAITAPTPTIRRSIFGFLRVS